MFYKKEEFPIEPLVRSIIDKHKIELESKEIQLQTNSNIKNQVIYADLNKMGMVFQNLISNAIKYTTNQNIIITFRREK